MKSENAATLTYNVQRDTFRIISTRLIGSLKIGMAEGKKKQSQKAKFNSRAKV